MSGIVFSLKGEEVCSTRKDVYDCEVYKIQAIMRDAITGSGSGFGIKIAGIYHSANVMTLKDGRKFVIHKVDYPVRNSDGQTAVVDLSEITGEWLAIGEPYFPPEGTTVRDLVRTSGSNYDVASDNCNHATARVNPNVESTTNRIKPAGEPGGGIFLSIGSDGFRFGIN